MENPTLITGGYDTKIHFWNAHRGDVFKSLNHRNTHVNSLEIGPDHQTLAVAGGSLVRLYDIQSAGQGDCNLPLCSYEGHTASISSIGFESAGRWLFTCSEDTTLKLWDSRCTGYQLCYENVGAPVNSAVLHPEDTTLIFGDQEGKLSFWDLVANKISYASVPEPGVAIKSVDISRDSVNLAVATYSGNLCLYSNSSTRGQRSLQLSKKILAHDGQYVLKCRFSPDSQYLATTSSDSTCVIWKNHPMGFYKGGTVSGHTGWVWDCVFSSDSAYILTASSDHTCKLWDIDTCQNVLEYIGHSKTIVAMALQDFVPSVWESAYSDEFDT